MKTSFLELLACPICRASLSVDVDDCYEGEIISGTLECGECKNLYPIKNGIPRFVPERNYASSFGFQWNRFSKTQLDSYSGLPISRDRLLLSTGWDWGSMEGKRVLDVGCGAGRFSEVALQFGATVVGVDYSDAVDAARANLSQYPKFEGVQASVYELPFRPGSFDYVYCLGVLQHTPDPARAFAALPGQAKAGGRVAMDIYPFLLRNILWSKYWLRPITRQLPSPMLMRIVERAVPPLLKVSRRISSVPMIGPKLKYLLPVANYDGVYPLSESQLREWSILDTFDMLSPEHDHPKSARTLASWFHEANLVEVEIVRKGHLIGRARRTEPRN